MIVCDNILLFYDFASDRAHAIVSAELGGRSPTCADFIQVVATKEYQLPSLHIFGAV